jgi:hypothetical protein
MVACSAALKLLKTASQARCVSSRRRASAAAQFRGVAVPPVPTARQDAARRPPVEK